MISAPLAVAGYSSPQYRQAEPSTTWDVASSFDETDALSGDHAYLNGFPTYWGIGPSPTLTDADSTTPPQMLYFNALMGFWRDCNEDGFIGNSLTGTEVYPVSLGFNENICPPGDGPVANAFYVNKDGTGFVNEFLWIGPDYYINDNGESTNEAGHTDIYEDSGIVGPTFEDRNDPRNVHDPEARVWADFGVPTSTPAATAALFPFPKGSLTSWSGTTRLVDLYLDTHDTLAPYGVDWNALATEVGATLDSTPVPNPLGIVKNLYNSSTEPTGGSPDCGRTTDCEGAYAQPFIVVWDCTNEDAGTAVPYTNPVDGTSDTLYVAPPVNPGPVNEDGTITGTYYQLGRGLGYGNHDDADSTGECDDSAAGGFGYWNLERTSAVGVDTPKKTDTDVDFYFYPKSRFSEPSQDDPRRGSDGNVTVPYTGVVDGADRWAGTGYGTFYTRGWKAGVIYVSIPSATNPLGTLQEFHSTSSNTFYGHSTLEAQGVGTFPTSGQYGQEHCTDGFGPGLIGDGFWECDPNHPDWQEFFQDDPEWNVVVGWPFNLRDVDCYDNTFGGFTTPRVAGGEDCSDRTDL